ncbi:MAG TPA: hypothetical protein PKE03_11635 [Bacteroidales bacterium]|nr:hypothetical protein [Bacteroidales bacterium]
MHTRIKSFFTDHRLAPLRNVLLFAFLLMSFHYFYLWWSARGFYPLARQVDDLFQYASDILFRQSVWILKNIFGTNIITDVQTIWVTTSTGQWGYVDVSPGCTSLKQWLHFIFIMLFFPGSWKHKLWYIPAGILVLHGVNIIRIVGLTLTLIPWSHHFNFFHDYIFKTFFYLLIFVMWVIWVEYFQVKPKVDRSKMGDQPNTPNL